MDDESYKDLEEFPEGELGGKMFNVRNVLQSIWIRCGTILSYYSNREYLIRQLNFVSNLGIIFWTIFLLTKII
jgi:hypothetical protein